MASIRTLRRKVASVKSTQKITKAMKLISAARLNRAQERILSARPFADKMESLIQNLSYLKSRETGSLDNHPFFVQRESRRVDVVLVTADRGLCGSFNVNLIRHTVKILKERPDDDIHLWIVGKKGRDYFRRFGRAFEKEYLNVFLNVGYRNAEVIGQDLIDSYLSSGSREVLVVYNEFKSRIQQRLVEKRVLPFHHVEGTAPRTDFIYEPGQEEILNQLLPRYIKGQVFRILLESMSAELAARMTAMDNATENAGEVIRSLTLLMNKVRQAAITTEISEIVGGAEALQA